MKNIFLVFVIASLFFVTACSKKAKEAYSPKYSSNIDQFFVANGAKKQLFTVNVSSEQATVTGENGSEISFPRNAFKTKGGQVVNEDVTIELREILNREAMILSNRPTTSGGRPLISGGQVYVNVTLNGEELELNDVPILISLPADSIVPEMSIFVGEVDPGTQAFDWVQVDSVQTAQQLGSSWVDNQAPFFYYDPARYIFSLSRLGWINCDGYYSIPNQTAIYVSCVGFENNESYNTKVFIVHKNINSISGMRNPSSDGLNFREQYLNIGDAVCVIAFSFQNNKEYIGIKELIITSEMSVELKLEERSNEEILQLVKEKAN